MAAPLCRWIKPTEARRFSTNNLSERHRRALALALNKTALNTGFDRDRLQATIIEIIQNEIELVDVIAFEPAEIDIITDTSVSNDDPADQPEEPQRDRPALTQPGDIWLLGPHKLICGDATDPATYHSLLSAERARQIVSDLPYNLKISTIVGLGSIKHEEFKEASGEMSGPQFQIFLDRALGLMRDWRVDGAIVMAFMDWRHIDQLLAAGRAASLELKNICVWNKTNAGMGSLYRSKHELIAIFKHGRARHVNNIELGASGRYRTNVWDYAGANTFGKNRLDDLKLHPTVKPIALIADAIKDCSRHGDIILDPFGGSGTTLLAAERTRRVARLIEIDPYYCDVTLERWRKLAGAKPKLVRRHREAS